MLTRIHFICVGTLLACSMGVFADGAIAPVDVPRPQEIKKDSTVESLKVSNIGEAPSIGNKILRSYDDASRALTEFIETNQDTTAPGDGRKTVAILTLGQMRAVWSVRVLMANLMFVPKYDPREFAYRAKQEDYPAAVALVQIGSPAAESVVERITQSPFKAERDLCAWVLDQIDGRDLCLAHLVLLKGKYNGDGKIRLEEAIETVQHLSLERDLAVQPEIQPAPKAPHN